MVVRARPWVLLWCLLLASCQGRVGDPAARPDPGTTEEPTDPLPEEPRGPTDPNSLDQSRLFTCEAPAASSSPARIRRLIEAQFDVRFVPSPGAAPYASDERFRYSTDARDARLDEGATEQLITRALRLGQNAATRMISWPACMRRATERPARACLEEWAPLYLLRSWQRDPTEEEAARLVDYAEESMDRFGFERGLALAAARPFLAPEFLFKEELGDGELDADGRRRLGSWPIARAIAAAVTDMALVRYYSTREVDEPLFDALAALREAAETDALESREQVEAHARALLEVPVPTDPGTGHLVLPTNIRRFFREYLGHPRAPSVFKSGGNTPREAGYIYWAPAGLPVSMDASIALLYADDTEFLRGLLTTREFVINTNNEKAWVYNLADGDDSTPEDIPLGPMEMPADQRGGLLTHPAWLAAHSQNRQIDPNPVHRGRWIQENILCGTIPDLPISVDAKLAHAPDRGVRERLQSVTGPDANGGYCWSCHSRMDPLGLPFEIYDHYGRYRTEEKTQDGSFVPVDGSSTLVATGDPALDGRTVADAIELSEALAGSERVEGCFVRQTFRYFMGRPETYEDACTLAAMRGAYRDGGGSFREMLVALLASDTFLYRHAADIEGADMEQAEMEQAEMEQP